MDRPNRQPSATFPLHPDWDLATFGDCELDLRRRVLLCEGEERPLEPRAFDVLVALIEFRDRVVTKDELIEGLWPDDTGNDGALSRVLMKIRRAVQDTSVDAPLVSTLQRVGYRFTGSVRVGRGPTEATRAPKADVRDAPPHRRLAWLPIESVVTDGGPAWIELGLLSLLGKALGNVKALDAVPVQDVLLAVDHLSERASLEQRIAAVRSALEPDLVAWGRLSGVQGAFEFTFGLQSPSAPALRDRVFGDDPLKLALDAAERIRAWLEPGANVAAPVIDFGDQFLNHTFARALQCLREGRLVESEHLLDVLRDADIHHAEFQHAWATVLVHLGRPQALAAVDELEATAHTTGDTLMRIQARLLRGAWLAHRWRLSEAAESTTSAETMAAEGGHEELALRCMIDGAFQLVECFDTHAAIVASRAIPRAERLGNQVLVQQAYTVAGACAALRQDWHSAIRHYEVAISSNGPLGHAGGHPAKALRAGAQLELGELTRAIDAGLSTYRQARETGMQADIGVAAWALFPALLAGRRAGEALDLLVEALAPGNFNPKLAASCQVHGRAPLLRLVGRHDDALVCIASTIEQYPDSPSLRSAIDVARLLVLLHARRFEEVEAAADAMRQTAVLQDPRVLALADWADAMTTHLAAGETDRALDRLDRVVDKLAIGAPRSRLSLDAAWIHLERGDVARATHLLPDVHAWLDDSPEGLLVLARVNYCRGEWEAAAALQAQFARRYPESQGPFEAGLLRLYERARREGRVSDAPRIDRPLSLAWSAPAGLADTLAARLDTLR